MFTPLAVRILLITSAVVLCGACTARDDSGKSDTAAMRARATATATRDSAPAPGGMMDPNTVTRDQLLALPGMDAAAADSLLARRPFDSMVAVDKALAPHLTDTERDSVYARLWKPIDLNTASGDEILLIPGVGARMRHEFEEYRPYGSIAKFRREIGKYVDEAEVARLERYVFVK